MKTDPEITKLKAKLEEIKAPENWSETTGPFFYIKLPKTPASGPYLSSGLKSMAQQQCFPKDTVIRDAKNIGEWFNIYTHPTFQRRRPQIVADKEAIPGDKIAHILVEGQKHGPLPVSEIKILLKQKDILLTDQVSFDDGHTWRKLYKFNDFDRREHDQGHLPDHPGWDIIEKSNAETTNQLKHPTAQQVELSTFAGLAYIESVQTARAHDQKHEKKRTVLNKDNKSHAHHSNNASTDNTVDADIMAFKRNETIEHAPPSETSNWTKNISYVAAICLMLGASTYMLLNDPMTQVNLLTNRAKTNKKLIKRAVVTRKRAPKSQQEVVQISEKQNKKYTATRINKIRTPPSRRPASITDTNNFQEARQMQERPFRNNEDPYQEYPYDDGSTPVSQDRVRKRLDKQTIDARNQYYDEDQRNEFVEVDSSPTVDDVWGNGISNRGKRSPAQEDGEDYPEDEQFDDDDNAGGY